MTHSGRFSIGSATLTSITESDAQIRGGETRQDYKDTTDPYTHLALPTIHNLEISLVPDSIKKKKKKKNQKRNE